MTLSTKNCYRRIVTGSYIIVLGVFWYKDYGCPENMVLIVFYLPRIWVNSIPIYANYYISFSFRVICFRHMFHPGTILVWELSACQEMLVTIADHTLCLYHPGLGWGLLVHRRKEEKYTRAENKYICELPKKAYPHRMKLEMEPLY